MEHKESKIYKCPRCGSLEVQASAIKQGPIIRIQAVCIDCHYGGSKVIII